MGVMPYGGGYAFVSLGRIPPVGGGTVGMCISGNIDLVLFFFPFFLTFFFLFSPSIIIHLLPLIL